MTQTNKPLTKKPDRNYDAVATGIPRIDAYTYHIWGPWFMSPYTIASKPPGGGG